MAKANEKVVVTAVEGQETLICVFSKAGDAELLTTNIATSFGDKVIKNGGTPQRRVVLVAKKLKEEDILKFIQ